MKRETIRYRWTAALLGIALCAMWQSDATAGDEGARPIPQVSEHRKALQEAVPAYAKGGSWKVFLGTCKELLAANAALTKEHQDSALAYKLKSLIEPLERDLAAPLPAFLKKKPKERTPEETIRYWVHHMQDDARAPSTWLGSPHPTAAEQLMAIGKPAIPFLIDAMDDRTPTRAIVQYPARRARPPYYLPELHRRSDLALRCLRWIVGTNPLHDNHWDKEFLPHLKEWWAMSKGKSQVQMIRNVIAIRQREQLKLQAKHGKQYTLDLRPMAADLATIAMIEGPEKVAPMLRKLLPTDRRDLGLKITYITRQVDPRAALAVRFTRYRAGNPHPFDLRELYTFGDKKTRADIRRFAKTGKNPKMAKLFADNPPAAKDPVDLLWSEEELTAMIHALEGNDPKARVRVLAGLVTARSFQVQRALLRALPKSKSAKERLVILTKLPEMPGYGFCRCWPSAWKKIPSRRCVNARDK